LNRRRSLGRCLIRALVAGGIAFAAILLFLVLLAVVPVGKSSLKESHPDPAADYAASAGRIRAVIDSEQGEVCDVCGTIFLTHGHKTGKAVVLIHGLTSSPRQFKEIGEDLYADGYNVLIARMPYHGLKSHTVAELGNLHATDLTEFADQTVDMAAGLGDELTVAGLSGGGTITGWIAQNRSDVDKAVR